MAAPSCASMPSGGEPPEPSSGTTTSISTWWPISSLAAHLVIRDDLSRAVGHGNPARLPAILLARSALHTDLQGQGHGGTLLAEAMSRAVTAADSVGARFVVVDAIQRYRRRRLPPPWLSCNPGHQPAHPEDERHRCSYGVEDAAAAAAGPELVSGR